MVNHTRHRRDASHWLRHGALALLAALLLALAGGPAPAQAQAQATFTLSPGGSAVIRFVAFCRDYGGSFPREIRLPETGGGRIAPEPVRSALAYIHDKGLAQAGTALQAQYAIWELQGITGLPTNNATSQAVLAAANTPVTNPPNASGIADSGYASGAWTLELLSWKPLDSPVNIAGGGFDNFYGAGELRVRSHVSDQRTLYFTVGLTFPPASPNSQRVAAYATNIQTSPGQLPVTSAGDLAPLAGVLLLGCAGGLHIWRRQRLRLMYTRRIV
jgi:hypothetical protein